MSTDLAFAKRGHRLVRAPGLGLTVADFLLLAFAALEGTRDALLHLRHHGLVHVLLCQLCVLGTALGRLELLIAHDHKVRCRDLPGKDTHTQLLVRLILEILIQGAKFVLVSTRRLWAIFVERSLLDVNGALEDEGRSCNGWSAVVSEIKAVPPLSKPYNLWTCAQDRHTSSQHSYREGCYRYASGRHYPSSRYAAPVGP